LLRAANTGVSGIVEQHGIVVDALAVNAQGVIDARLPVYLAETIDYDHRRIIGIIVVLLLVTAALVVNVRQSLQSN
jgi:apolipoprotein N-acyltransferase